MAAMNPKCHEKRCQCANCEYMCSRCFVSDARCETGVTQCTRWKRNTDQDYEEYTSD